MPEYSDTCLTTMTLLSKGLTDRVPPTVCCVHLGKTKAGKPFAYGRQVQQRANIKTLMPQVMCLQSRYAVRVATYCQLRFLLLAVRMGIYCW